MRGFEQKEITDDSRTWKLMDVWKFRVQNDKYIELREAV